MSDYLCLLLPYPPTANLLQRSGKGNRYPSKAYRAWEADAYRALKQQDTVSFVCPVRVTLALGKPDNRKRDIDNTIKPVLDFCQKPAGILVDDSQVHDVRAYWAADVENGCRIEVEAL